METNRIYAVTSMSKQYYERNGKTMLDSFQKIKDGA